MTCIVGLVVRNAAAGDAVLLGGDRAGVNGSYGFTETRQPKVFLREGIAFGFTTSFRMGQRLQHSMTVPKLHPTEDLMRWMVVDFVDAFRADMKAAGFASVKDCVEEGGTFLVGVRGRLFCVQDDLAVIEAARGYAAVGCGEGFAMGALHALRCGQAQDPDEMVRKALQAAADHSAGVAGPFDVVRTEAVA